MPLIPYKTTDCTTLMEVRFEGGTVWLSQRQMADLFQTTKRNISSLHIQNIFAKQELDRGATVKEYLTVQTEGTRQVTYHHYFRRDSVTGRRERGSADEDQGPIMKSLPVVFEEHKICRIYDEKEDTWYFSVVDIIQVLTQQPDYQAASNYWKVLKKRLGKEGSQSVTNCNRLKLPAADGKSYLTDVASAETLLSLVQSVPSPEAEPIKLWLAKVWLQADARDG